MIDYRKRRIAALLVVLGFIGSIGLIAYINKGNIRAAIEQIQGNDYPGPGHGSVNIVVKAGDTGESVAHSLVDAGVVKTFRTVYQLILDKNPTFYPGTYSLKLEMSSTEAIRVLSDPNSGAIETTTIKEGLRASAIFKVLSESTGIPIDEFNSLFTKPSEFGLPSNISNIEGYLFPATYNFPPGSTAKQVLQIMINRMSDEIKSFNIPSNKVHSVLTLASIIQKEARLKDDFYKVSAVFQNRIRQNIALQSDATVSYGVGGNTVSTSVADRADDNGWNTYLHPGLPIGPISAPGSLAIDAALNPTKGNWIYFCTINLETGETVFSETLAQHEKAVAEWQKWMKANPGYE